MAGYPLRVHWRGLKAWNFTGGQNSITWRRIAHWALQVGPLWIELAEPAWACERRALAEKIDVEKYQAFGAGVKMLQVIQGRTKLQISTTEMNEWETLCANKCAKSRLL